MVEFTVSRSTRIAADAARVHDYLDDFRQWRRWSPWEDVDPNLLRSYSGPASGPGACYAWEGNRKAGKGTMEITGTQPDRVDMVVCFEKPWKARNPVTFELRDLDGDLEGSGTEVTWTMTGENSGVAAVFARVVNMDKLLGKDFDRGLARLKSVVESDQR